MSLLDRAYGLLDWPSVICETFELIADFGDITGTHPAQPFIEQAEDASGRIV
jgi:hypothetical protein